MAAFKVPRCKNGTSLSEKLQQNSALNSNGCRIWFGSVNQDGYGNVYDPGRRHAIRAHRAAWEVARGAIPAGMCVCHECDTPACINLDHLFLGTQAENVADRDRKGRRPAPKGRLNGNATLCEPTVRAIRNAAGKHRDIAAAFGVCKSQVTGIKNRQRWAHVN